MSTKSKTKTNTKRRISLRRAIIIAMWGITAIGVVALTTLFILAKNEILGPMPTFE